MRVSLEYPSPFVKLVPDLPQEDGQTREPYLQSLCHKAFRFEVIAYHDSDGRDGTSASAVS